MKVTFLGHAAFLVDSAQGKVLIDPFLTGNGQASVTADQLIADRGADAILLTHGHGDHVGDTEKIARALNLPVVAVAELAAFLRWRGCKTSAQHIGGGCDYPFGRVKFTHATHGTGFIDDAAKTITYCGGAAGVMLTAEGRTVWHLGDTGLTADLALVGRRQTIDLALVPIGDHFTMGPEDAAEAVRMIQPKLVVPCHYNTFPPIAQDPADFIAAVAGAADVRVLSPGEAVVI